MLVLSLALSSWSLHRHLPYFGDGTWSPGRAEKEIPITAFPALARANGIGALEICQTHLASPDDGYLATVREAIEAANCRLLNVPIDTGNLARPEVEVRVEELRRIEAWVEAAHRLGSPAVRVNTGRVLDGDEVAAFGRAVEGFRRLAAFCAERGMTLLLENHWGLSAAPATIMALRETIDAPNLGLCPDFGNFAPEVREEGLRQMLPYARMVHAKVLDVDAAGRHTGFDLGRCLQLLRESGYEGPLSIEFEGKGDQQAGIAAAKRLLTAHLADLL